MHTQTITAEIETRANAAVNAERAARLRLAERAADPEAALTGYDHAEALKAAGMAAPWKDLLQLIERTGNAEKAIKAARRSALAALTEEHESLSTSALTNEIERFRREGLRSLLRDTAFLTPDAEVA